MNYYGIERSEEYLAHFGTKRHSGRYPWGTGDRPYQDDPENLSKNEVKRLVKEYNETHGTKIKVKNAIIKKDGNTYTSKGKKISDTEVISKNAKDKKNEKEIIKNKEPEFKKMSDDELSKTISRMDLEKRYLQDVKDLNPHTTSLGKKYASLLGDTLVKSMIGGAGAAVNVATANVVKKALGVQTPPASTTQQKKN